MLHRKIARLLATQNAIDVFGALAKIIPEVDPIGDEPAGRDGAFAGVNRRQAMPPSQRDNEISLARLIADGRTMIPPFSCIAKDDMALSNSGGIVDGARYDLDPQARRGFLDRIPEGPMWGASG